MGGQEMPVAVCLHQIGEKAVSLLACTVFKIASPETAGLGMAYQSVFTGQRFGGQGFGITGGTGMVVDMGNIKSDFVFKKEMKKGGRIGTAGKGEEDFPLSQPIKMKKFTHVP